MTGALMPYLDGRTVHTGDVATVLDGVRAMLRLAGRDPDEAGVADTPARFLRAWLEMTAAPGDPAELMGRVFTDTDAPADQLVAVGPVEFVSVCEHHLLPFTGVAWVGYIPAAGRVVGLSKLPRLVEHYARRPQVQERMTAHIADAINAHLAPVGVGVMVRATHACMALRGVRKPGAVMVTSAVHGALREDASARAEFLALAHG